MEEEFVEYTSILEDILEEFKERKVETLNGFDDAIIGIDKFSVRIIYSVKKCIDIVQNKNNIELLDAIEYFENKMRNVNIIDNGPIFCEDRFLSLL